MRNLSYILSVLIFSAPLYAFCEFEVDFSAEATCSRILAVLKLPPHETQNYGMSTGLPNTFFKEIIGEGTPEQRYRRVREYVLQIPLSSEAAHDRANIRRSFLIDFFRNLKPFSYELDRLSDLSFVLKAPTGVILIIRNSDGKMFQGSLPNDVALRDIRSDQLEFLATFVHLLPDP